MVSSCWLVFLVFGFDGLLCLFLLLCFWFALLGLMFGACVIHVCLLDLYASVYCAGLAGLF